MKDLVVFATLRIAADELNPDETTRVLHRRPTVAASKGNPLYPGSTSNIIARTGTWFLTTETMRTRIAQEHLQEVYGVVARHVLQLKDMYPRLEISFSLISEECVDIPDELAANLRNLGRLEIVRAERV